MRKTLGFFLTILSIASGEALAGTTVGTINQIIQRASDGLTYVVINGTISGQPACATAGYFMIQNENSESGKKQFAMLMLAKASGLRVIITGAGTCSRWVDGEDINGIQLID
jgi:hypothetical protein